MSGVCKYNPFKCFLCQFLSLSLFVRLIHTTDTAQCASSETCYKMMILHIVPSSYKDTS